MSLSFACKIIREEDLIKCSFNLNKTGYKVFIFLMKDNESTVSEIARVLYLDRTSVQKAIKDLLEKNLVIRKQKNLKKGSFAYFYQIINKDEMKVKAKALIEIWAKKAKDKIDEL